MEFRARSQSAMSGPGGPRSGRLMIFWSADLQVRSISRTSVVFLTRLNGVPRAIAKRYERAWRPAVRKTHDLLERGPPGPLNLTHERGISHTIEWSSARDRKAL